MADPLATGASFGGYEIEGVAGRGGMGIVYRARQLRPSRRVALKVITPDLAQDPDFRRRFERESESAAAIEHPHVVPVYEVSDVGGALFIAMRFVEGTDLRALLRERGALDPRRAADLVGQVASALDAAHEHGLVHRDVKPGNVLIAGSEHAWHAYLTDFGLTKSVSAESGVTTSGMFVGTLDYIAPEQLLGGPVDARADVYALGCVLYESLTGQVPYPRDTVVAVMYAHGNEPPPSALSVRPDLPPEFDDVIRRAMAKDPADRYPSAGDLGRAAQAAAHSELPGNRERSVATGQAAPSSATPAAGRSEPEPVASPDHTAGAGALAAAHRPAHPSPAPAAPVAQGPSAGAARRRNTALAAAAALLVVLIAALAFALSGGGGSSGTKRLSKSDYDVQASDALKGIDASLAERRLAANLPSNAGKRALVSSDLASVESALNDAADKLGALEPPSDADSVHAHAKAVVRALARSLGEARAASDAGNVAAFRTAADRYKAARNDAVTVTAEYKRRGYSRLGDINPASP